MKELAKNTYTYQIKRWLESGRSITSKQAIDELGCTRLAVITSNLRHHYNMPIKSDNVIVKNRNGRSVEIAKYYLMEAV